MSMWWWDLPSNTTTTRQYFCFTLRHGLLGVAWVCLHMVKLFFFSFSFEMTLDVLKHCKNSTKNSLKVFIQILSSVTLALFFSLYWFVCTHTPLYLSEMIQSCRHKVHFTPKYFLKQEHSLREQWHNCQNREINLEIVLYSNFTTNVLYSERKKKLTWFRIQMIEFLIFTFVTSQRLKFYMEINNLSSPTPSLLLPLMNQNQHVFTFQYCLYSCVYTHIECLSFRFCGN